MPEDSCAAEFAADTRSGVVGIQAIVYIPADAELNYLSGPGCDVVKRDVIDASLSEPDTVACRRRGFLGLAGATLALKLTGCGVLLHPERVGQPKGEMDWEIVALDALGLILFFVPGVIAFIVDFSTGAIYLPPRSYSGLGAMPDSTERWRMVTVPPNELNQSGIAETVTRETGQEVDLSSPDIQSRRIDSVESFTTPQQLFATP